jgi:integrase/recombinase XerD
MKEKVILSICSKAMSIMSTETTQELRRILESELYAYDLTVSCTSLVPYQGPPEKLRLFLASKRLDGLSPLTLERYAARLVHFCRSIQKPLEDVDSMDIRAYLSAYSQTGVMASTLSTAQTVLKSFFAWLSGEDMIKKSPMLKIRPTKTPKRQHRFLSAEQMELLRVSCRDARDRAILEAYYSTGCRVSELLSANRYDINWSTGTMKVIGKGNKERTVYIHPRAMVYVQRYLDGRKDTCPALFVTERKPERRMCVKATQDVFKRLGKIAGINQRVHPHLLRHTVATTMLRNGAAMQDIQRMLGHVSPATTQRYAETDDSAVMETHRKCS